MFLEQVSSNFGIEVETGAANVLLSGDIISGTWRSAPKVVRIGSPRPVAVELLNATESVSVNRHPEVALKFTKKFGALTSPYRSGSSFHFSLAKWREKQVALRATWAFVLRAGRNDIPIKIPVEKGEYFSFNPGRRLSFRTQSLDTFISLEIAWAPRLCICANRLNGCKTPFFIDDDLREKYCSETCAQAGMRLAKLRWWNKNRKGMQGGTQKTR
jgi:hypothetical protein